MSEHDEGRIVPTAGELTHAFEWLRLYAIENDHRYATLMLQELAGAVPRIAELEAQLAKEVAHREKMSMLATPTDYMAEQVKILREQLAAVTKEREGLQEKVLRMVREDFGQMCSYCGWETGKEGGTWDQLQAHIHTCSAHPIAKLTAERDAANLSLAGAVDVAEKLADALDGMSHDANISLPQAWHDYKAIAPADFLARAKEAMENSERYKWLRECNWHDDAICVVTNPKETVRLGAYCPSNEQLDAAIDAARRGERP